MLNRYIGNKKQVLSSVAEAIADCASPGDLVCDAFSGTLAVSLALKQRGYRVASNDINLLSAMYGAAFRVGPRSGTRAHLIRSPRDC